MLPVAKGRAGLANVRTQRGPVVRYWYPHTKQAPGAPSLPLPFPFPYSLLLYHCAGCRHKLDLFKPATTQGQGPNVANEKHNNVVGHSSISKQTHGVGAIRGARPAQGYRPHTHRGENTRQPNPVFSLDLQARGTPCFFRSLSNRFYPRNQHPDEHTKCRISSPI